MTEDYMAQEEDWDRDLLLDPAWEKQQRKVGGQLEREKTADPRCMDWVPGPMERLQESCWVMSRLGCFS